MAKHRDDGGRGFSVHGRDNQGARDGENNPGRDAEAEADARAQRYAERHRDK